MHPDTVREYPSLKFELAERFRHYREGYARAKPRSVEKVVASALTDRFST